MLDGNVSVTRLVCALVADPGSAYLQPTDLLERAAAVIRASYTGAIDAPTARPEFFRGLRAAEDAISGVLRARRENDMRELQALARQLAAFAYPPVQPNEPPPDRGWRVKPRVPNPPLPPAPAAADSTRRV